MKAFFVGLLFLLAVGVLSGLGILFFPFILVLSLALRVLIVIAFFVLAVWLVGKFIMFLWSKMK
ncbi:MAG: hypothetical protein V1662_05075 [Candidatus Omnitrophota bacterium]